MSDADELERLRAINAELVEAHNTLLIETARPTTVYDCAYSNARYAEPCDRCLAAAADTLWRAAKRFVVEGTGPNSEYLIDLSDATMAYGHARRQAL